jgi:hypothetical protein
MPKRSRKNGGDPNELAARIVAESTGDSTPHEREAAPEKNPAAVALGRLGGLKGGKARAAKLSAKKRSAIARKAASARWKKHASE